MYMYGTKFIVNNTQNISHISHSSIKNKQHTVLFHRQYIHNSSWCYSRFFNYIHISYHHLHWMAIISIITHQQIY